MTDWSKLLNSIEKAEKLAESKGEEFEPKIDPEDPDSRTYIEAEKAYLKARMEVFAHLEERRYGGKAFSRVIFKQRKEKGHNHIPQDTTYQSTMPYIFLQHIGAIHKWARETYDLSSGEVDLMLYLYPIGIWNSREQYMLFEAFGSAPDQGNQLSYRLRKKGHIIPWDKSPNVAGMSKVTKYWTLSRQMEQMCSRMHSMCLMQQEIPETHNNKLIKKDKYWKPTFEAINKQVAQKKKAREFKFSGLKNTKKDSDS